MILGDRLRLIREAKQLSQTDIEKRTGLLQCYVSRIENGHTVPSIETLEKWAAALEVSLYRLFYEGEEPPLLPNLLKRLSADDIAWGSPGNQIPHLRKLRRALSCMKDRQRNLLLSFAERIASLNRGLRPKGKNFR
jgi:transcriptional regulator with XRE-family HTH domain